MKKDNLEVNILYIAALGLFFIIIGMHFNYTAITTNNCKMPVHFDEGNLTSLEHFTFQDYSQIEYPYFSDIIYIFGFIISIGDIFLVIGIIIFFMSVVALNTTYIIKRKIFKHTKT